MTIKKYSYFPILKTSYAELKGYLNLDDEIKDNILPIFELTKSRISKHNKHGDVYKQFKKLQEATKSRKFILDLTTELSLSNTQIESILSSPNNGYEKWIDFLNKIDCPNVIPIIHYNDLATEDDNRMQINSLEMTYTHMAFRVSVFDDDLLTYLNTLTKHIKDMKKFILILDAGFIPVDKVQEKSVSVIKKVNDIVKATNIENIIISSSGFPSNVLAKGYGKDDYGAFNLSEVSLFEQVANETGVNIKYSDYASVHPIRYITKGGSGGWIPRIDSPLEESCYYYRVRKQGDEEYADAYANAAKKIIKDDKYKSVTKYNTWGDSEILQAANGSPNGRSPSYWIAVRINIHLTKQYIRTHN